MKEQNKFDLEAPSVDIKAYLFKIVQYWKVILIILVMALLVAKFINLRTQKIYNLSSLITVKEEQNPLFTSSTNIAFNWGGTSDNVSTIMAILKSRTQMKKWLSDLI